MMGYLHIPNLYRPEAQPLLNFKWLWYLEKIHGTSANIRLSDGQAYFSSGGVDHNHFAALFCPVSLIRVFNQYFSECNTLILYGEAYGGKCQKMSATYGKQLKFVVFDVKINGTWLDVEEAYGVCMRFGLEFVPYGKTLTDEKSLQMVRDEPSVQAQLNGITEPKPMEGVVLRPPFECFLSNGDRLIAKYKRPEFSERSNEPVALSPEKLKVLQEANAIAQEWVTPMRLTHVLDHLGNPVFDMALIPQIIAAMKADIAREAAGEIIVSEQVWKAVAKKTASLYKMSTESKECNDE